METKSEALAEEDIVKWCTHSSSKDSIDNITALQTTLHSFLRDQNCEAAKTFGNHSKQTSMF